jgi:hypothetical protein
LRQLLNIIFTPWAAWANSGVPCVREQGKLDLCQQGNDLAVFQRLRDVYILE